MRNVTITLLSVWVLLIQALMANEPITPLPKTLKDIDLEKARLGRSLFFDPILSSDRSVSCASCHDILHAGGADKRVISLGIGMRAGNIQAPTVLNSRYNFKQFWNGRADTLYEQANGPIHNPVEMAIDATTIERRLNSSESYLTAFGRIYPQEDITYDMVLEVIVEFEKALVTPNSRFDQYLRKEISLDRMETTGYQLFKELGCVTCHNGINIGGNSFQKMGLITPYPYDKAIPDLYATTKRDQHKNVFKVPTLRNIELTAPYFHDGSASTLQEAIKKMSHHNLGYIHSDEEVDAIAAFLRSLTGETPAIMRE